MLVAPDMGQDVVPYVYRVRDDLLEAAAPRSYFSGEHPIRRLRIGTTEYRLRRPMTGRAYPATGSAVEFIVEDLAPHIVGMGMTASAAFEDWRLKVHAHFQQLLALRPFEMSAHDREVWRALNSVIDSAQFRRSIPVRMRELGRVSYKRLWYPCSIRWASGGADDVSFDVVPPEFPSLRAGQWIEAICERDPLTGRLLRVTHMERVPEVRMMSRTQQDDYWESLPTSESLAESDVDWTRHG
jgi:hypothetical protein